MASGCYQVKYRSRNYPHVPPVMLATYRISLIDAYVVPPLPSLFNSIRLLTPCCSVGVLAVLQESVPLDPGGMCWRTWDAAVLQILGSRMTTRFGFHLLAITCTLLLMDHY
jgi:hypothetical protein